MIGLLVGLIVLSWLLGRSEGLIGGLAGGFVGALVVVGMTAATRNGELAGLHSPEQLASTALSVAVVGAALALVAPYLIGSTAAGWAIGALLAAIAAPGSGQSAYVLPFAAHALAGAAVVCVTRRRTRAGCRASAA